MSNNGSNGSVESPELVRIPALVRGFMAKYPQETVNALVEYGILERLGYVLVKVESNGHKG